MMRGKLRRNRKGLAVAAASAAIVGVLYQLLSRADAPPAPSPSELVAGNLRLTGPYGPAFAGEMVAVGAGLFEREGLRIALQPGQNADDSISAVANDTAVVGVSRADRFLMARARGVPIVAFAAAFIESPAAFYALKKSGVRGPGDFVNRPIGRREGDDTAVAFEALTRRLGVPRSMIREVPVGSDLSMLLRGEVDVWPGHVGDEDYALARQGVDYVKIQPGNFGVHLPGTVYFASERTVRERGQLVLRFLKAVIAGWEMTYGDYGASVPMIVGYDEKALTPERVRFVLDRQREYLRPLAMRFGEFADGQWQTLQDVLLGERLFERRVDLAKAVTNEFLRDTYRGRSVVDR
jgi:ABC-type nitrate/sulfonate/bicarbonate transport system substrate-binding protein